ncbi:MAG: response regulator [Patescibacteria group bacterium]|nr:response regulator [Patescibacteria group bacterium]
MADEKKILIVEDEEAIRNALRPRFEKVGITVIEAPDGHRALELAEHEHPRLILLDVIMPKMHGIDMLDTMRAQAWGKAIPVILLTNYADDPKVTQAVSAGRCEIMDKTKCKLDDVIKKAVEKVS